MSNDEVFRVAATTFNVEAHNKAVLQADSFRKAIQEFLKDYMDDLFLKMIALKGDYSSGWEPLNKNYVDKKLSYGGNSGFMDFFGDLEKYLMSADSISMLGAPRVLFSPGQGGGLAQGVMQTTDRRGQIRYRGPNGRFVSGNNAFNWLSYTLEIRMFPAINNRRVFNARSGASRLFSKMDDSVPRLNKAVGKKQLGLASRFAVFEHGNGRQPARALLKPFLEWYATDNLRSSLSSEYGIRI